MANNPVESMAQGRQLTLAEWRALVEDPSAAWSDKHKRLATQGLRKYERQQRERQLDGVNSAVAQMREQQRAMGTRLQDDEKRLTEVRADVRLGKVEPGVAERVVKGILLEIARHREALDRLDQSIERVREVADLDPALWQSRNLDRFPLTSRSLPILTAEWLNDEPGAIDPFGAS